MTNASTQPLPGENVKPFLEKTTKCPVCGKESLHIFLKDRTYVIERREEDGYISKYHWVDPHYTRYNLHQYFFWHCIHCKFTEEKSTFLKKPSELLFRQKQLIKKYREVYSKNPVIEHLSRYINYPYTDFLSQVSLHYLAIYIQQVVGESDPDLLKIARYYHRLYWMFQTIETNKNSMERSKIYDEYKKYYEMMQSNFMNALANLEDLNQWLDRQIQLEKEQNVPGWVNFQDKIHQLYQSMTRHMDDVLLRLNEYNKLGNEFREVTMAGSGNLLHSPFHEYPSYLKYISQVQSYWPGVPLDQQTVLKGTINAYRDIIRNKVLEDKKLKLFHVYRLLIFFYLKIQDYENALYTTQRLLDKANAFRDAADRRLKRLQVIQDDRVDAKLLAEYIQKTEDIINKYSNLKTHIRDMKIEWDTQRAREIYMNNRNLSLDELRAKLLQNHIDESVVEKICEEKRKESKKGIFQIFKF